MSQLGTEKSALQHAEEEAKLLAPIRAHIGEIQAKIDVLRKDGSDQVQKLKNRIQLLKEDKHIKKEKKDALIAESNAALSAAQAVESKNQAEVAGLVAEAESYLKEHYEKDYFGPVSENCKKDRESAKLRYQARVAELGKEHEQEVQRLRKENAPDLQQELKDENYVYKNKLFDAKVTYEQELQAIKDRRHEAFAEQYHMIDLLRMSRFTFAQEQAQRIENYKYTFNQRQFLLKNGLYIVIVMIFIALSIVTPIVKNTQLFTYNNILNILQQASPRMFLALGVAGLILLTGTDLSIGRMTGMGMVAATIIMHKGINTGAVFGKIFDFTSLPYAGRAIFALLVCIVLTTCFTSVAGFFTARFKMHPFISTMSNMLIIFGLVTYATKGVSFGAIEPGIASMIVPKVNGFPLIILWAVAAIVIVWFIWNKTRFGKNLYAVGGNPEAASVSGISVFAVTMGAFMMAGVLYGFGAWLECARMVGSGSAAYGQGWDMDAIAACVVGGVSFTGGIGKISGVVVGVLIFTALTYSLTILGIDTNLQFVFEGIIILTAVTLDCLKYVQKK
ncbi:MAG: galactoside ABC transporter permease [Stomatobaculum longum]|nr:galactoside ABC transporter permease [Stomatobaculum longum]